MVFNATFTCNKFQPYRGGQFYWWMNQEYPAKTADLSRLTDKFYHERERERERERESLVYFSKPAMLIVPWPEICNYPHRYHVYYVINKNVKHVMFIPVKIIPFIELLTSITYHYKPCRSINSLFISLRWLHLYIKNGTITFFLSSLCAWITSIINSTNKSKQIKYILLLTSTTVMEPLSLISFDTKSQYYECNAACVILKICHNGWLVIYSDHNGLMLNPCDVNGCIVA